MRKFCLKSIFFLTILAILGLSIFCFADGTTDPFYLRFTSPKQTSLVLGTSRAAQGIQPKILNQILKRDKSKKIYNYSFTLGHSPYGPTYLESIKSKIDLNTKTGVFIVTVDPWSISALGKNINDFSDFKENERALGLVKFNNLNPNIPYLLYCFNQPYINIFKNKYKQSSLHLHPDGWLEVHVPMDSTSLSNRVSKKIDHYQNINLHRYHFSETRLNYLLKTIIFLKDHGTVYLIRLPVHPLMLEIEYSLMPDFSKKIRGLVESTEVDYFDMTTSKERYEFTDGNHLHKNSGAKVSKQIAEWIKNQK